MSRRTTSTCVVAVVALATALAGCASWESEVAFPETYRDSYTKVATCRKSAHPAANYIETWISPDGVEAWHKLGVQLAANDTVTTAVIPEGTVLVKVQYDDSKCETLAGYTVMKKLGAGVDPEVGDWRWQFVNDSGGCNDCALRTSCAGCHSGCKPAPFMCTSPSN